MKTLSQRLRGVNNVEAVRVPHTFHFASFPSAPCSRVATIIRSFQHVEHYPPEASISHSLHESDHLTLNHDLLYLRRQCLAAHPFIP